MRRIAVAIFSVLVVGCVAAIGASPAAAAGPTAIGVDSDGIVYVGFASGGQIKRYSGVDGSALSSWGTPGSAAGQIGGVVAIDVAPGSSGNVWVLDTNRRVQEFTRAGAFIRGVQLAACGSGIVTNPLARGGLDVTNDNVYVAHPCANSLLRLQKSNLQTMATTSPTQPKGVSTQLYTSAPANTVATYVARPAGNSITILNPNSFSAGTPTAKASTNPTDVFVDAFGVLFATDATNNVIHMYGSDLNEFRTLGGTGSAAGKLNNPMAIDVFEQYSDLAGNIFIADYGNNRIQRWSSGGFTYWTAAADDTAGGPAAPVNTVAPAISGTATQGQTVTCSQGTWTNSPTSYAYSWSRDGSPIGGATSSTYVIQAADVAHNLTCTVTATNAGGSGTATSAAVVPNASVSAPVNTGLPVISGTPTPGNTLTCSQGTWSGSPTSYAYEWRRDGSAVATGNTYAVTLSDVGHVMTCAVTATNAAGSTTAVSNPVTVTSGACTTGTTGVSINAAATFTNSPGVTLTMHEPSGATGVVISNDGGFATPTTAAIACGDTYAWTLTSSGSERLPKTVYVRFTGSGIDADKTFTDEIILDETAPAMSLATMRTAKAAPASTTRYVLMLKGSDAGSGVSKVQLATSRNARTQTTYRYRSSLKLRYLGAARFVRAIDRAGNVGRWKAVKLSKALARR
jgi:hypothetical protein